MSALGESGRSEKGFWKIVLERPLYACDLNRSMQHLHSSPGEGGVENEGGKLATSVIFWDFGITDSITDKHRTYQGNVVIPVTKVSGNADGEEPNGTGQSDTAPDPLGMSVGGDEESDAAVRDQSSNEPR